jgi:nucleotide-binding universal stress UspA family protein
MAAMHRFPPSAILVPVDFGEASAHAVRAAGALAERVGARLTVLHAESLEAPPYFTHDQIEKLERQRLDARGRATRYLAEFAGRLTGAPIDPLVVDGPPAEAVLRAVPSSDLVVMGTHGYRGPKRWWLGSVAERVVRAADRPVLVVRAGSYDTPAGQEFRRILVAGSPEVPRQHAERYANQLAQALGGTLLEPLEACHAADAERLNATLLAIPRSPHAAGWLGETPERLIRSCALPMLFVPGE